METEYSEHSEDQNEDQHHGFPSKFQPACKPLSPPKSSNIPIPEPATATRTLDFTTLETTRKTVTKMMIYVVDVNL